jgi:hypothetical protein
VKDHASTVAARQKAKALARWEGEGGALGAPTMMLDERDMRILARLGAAMLINWDMVSEDARGAISSTASTLHAERHGARIKAEIARFLDKYNDQ